MSTAHKKQNSEPVVEESSSKNPKTEDPLLDFKEKMIEEEKSSPNASAKKNYMWPILFVFIIAIASLIGMFIYRNVVSKSEKINVVSLSPTPTAIPEPTKTVDLKKYEIKILNGSEVAGEAGRQKDSLQEEGFTVSSVGNADKSDYTKTIIQAKRTVDKDFLDKLKSVLEVSFNMGDNEELPEDSDPDIIVILGSQAN